MKRNSGFTLIELLIVVGIIGILAAIAVPNLLQAMQKAKQKRTMADIRLIATAWEAYHVENNTFVAAGTSTPQFDWPTPPITHDDLVLLISPTYLRKVPAVDGWGTPLEFSAARDHYAIRSYGKEGVPDGAIYTVFNTTVFNCDIVYADGSFVVYPVGTQQSSS